MGLSWLKVLTVYCYLGLWWVKIRTMSVFLFCRHVVICDDRQAVLTTAMIFLTTGSIKHLWGRRCAICEPPDYGHSTKVKTAEILTTEKSRDRNPVCLLGN